MIRKDQEGLGSKKGESVALEISRHRNRMFVSLDRKRLEHSLITGPVPDECLCRMPGPRVRYRDPSHDFG